MTSTAVQRKPAVDYFSLSTSKPQNTSFQSPLCWETSPNDFSLPSPETCDSNSQSPISSSTSYPAYNFLSSDDCAKDQVFNFGSFNDWMGWDEPSCNALTPEESFFPELKTEPMSPVMGHLDPQTETGYTLPPIQNGMDSGIFGEDPIADEPLFQTAPNPLGPQEQLYSTPLTWSRLSPRPRRPYSTHLSPEEESHLRAIAMPSFTASHSHSQSQSHSQTHQKKNKYPRSPSTTASSPETRPSRRKRKSSTSSLSDDEEEIRHSKQSSTRHPAPKKTAHNMIEKRYRTNLNDKIAALRDSVPSLRVVGTNGERGVEDLEGLTPAHKLNKATVLAKATEYISHLEKRNQTLSKESEALKSRVEAFEILMMARGEGPRELKYRGGRRVGERR